MRISFYAPMKPLSDPRPSGDQMIARDLHDFFVEKGHEVEILSEFRARWFYHSAVRSAEAVGSLAVAALKARKFDPDLFFTYHSYYKCPDTIAPALSRALGRPYVIYEGIYSDSPSRKPETWLGWKLNCFALDTADHVFTDKSIDFGSLKKRVPAERSSYIPPSVDISRFSADPGVKASFRRRHGIGADETVIASAAMLRPGRKAESVQFLIRSLGALKRQGLKFRLVHAGGGDCLDEVRALGSDVLGDDALILGTVPRAEVCDLMKAADLFGFPGIDEPFGLVYIEAQGCGIPVVAFRNKGVPDAVADGVSGFLTPRLDSEAHEAALVRMIRDADLRKRMGAQAREYVLANHDRAVNYGRVLERCEELVGGNA